MLSNYLKELVSFRQFDLSEERLLVERLKEKVCRVSEDFVGDMKSLRKAGE